MADSLKDANKFPLYTVIAVNLLVFYSVVKNNALINTDWITLFNHIDQAIPAGLGLIFTGIINAQLSAMAKSRIVFLKWHHPLPGSRAFSHYASSDTRIDTSALDSKFGPLPTAPSDQNALWYKLYQSVASEAAILQVHKSFLFTRDYAVLALMMLLVLGIAGFIQIPDVKVTIGYVVILFLQFVFVSQAARNHGQRFVTTVLAMATAK